MINYSSAGPMLRGGGGIRSWQGVLSALVWARCVVRLRPRRPYGAVPAFVRRGGIPGRVGFSRVSYFTVRLLKGGQ